MAAALVKFVSCSLASYNALPTKDPSTLYFVTDERRLYKGAVPFSGGIFKAVSAYPEKAAAEINTIYVNTTDGSAKFYNGSDFVTIVKPQPAAISGAGLATELATTKAVVDYVAIKIADLNVGNINSRLDAAEGKLDTIQGTGEGSISKALSDAKAYTDALANGAVKTNTDNIAALQTGKADKATTLAGYGIADAYTKSEADSAIAQAVSNAGHLKREIVAALPEVGAADIHTVYMVPKADAAGDQKYDEYMLINGAFEKIGDTKVDLTDYATKTYAETKANEALAAAKTDAQAKIDALNKPDTAQTNQYVTAVSESKGVITVSRQTLPVYSVATGSAQGTIAVNGSDVAVKGLGSAAFTDSSAYATAAQGTKADSALQVADVTEGATNGTIAIRGTDVAVHGLGTAAYANTDAFDAAGAANQALANAKKYVDDMFTWTEL